MENLLTQIKNLQEEIANFSSEEKDTAEIFRIRFIGSNGSVKSFMSEMRNVPPDQKKEMGKALNELKIFAEGRYEALKKIPVDEKDANEKFIDLS